jgi:hypothetical protein
MKKFLSITLITVFAFAISFTACKKYEEGPMLSLAFKKARIVNVWKIEKAIWNGTDVTSQMAAFISDYTEEYKKDGSYIANYGSGSTTGTWEFDTKKEYLLVTPAGSSSADRAEIIRLKSNELWIRSIDGSDTFEYHYVSD